MNPTRNGIFVALLRAARKASGRPSATGCWALETSGVVTGDDWSECDLGTGERVRVVQTWTPDLVPRRWRAVCEATGRVLARGDGGFGR